MDIRQWFLKYAWAVNILLLALLAYILAGTANKYVSSKIISLAPQKSSRKVVLQAGDAKQEPPVDSIIPRDLFNASLEGGREISLGMQDSDTAEIKETKLRLALMGIAFFGESVKYNIATIKNLQDQKIELYQAGSPVGEDAVLFEVKYDRVILERGNGDREELLLAEAEKEKTSMRGGGQGKGRLSKDERDKQKELFEERQRIRGGGNGDISDRIRQVGENEFVIQKSAIDDALANLNSIVTQARVIPNFTGTGDERTVDGFRIYRIQPGSIFLYLGLQNGDVIKSINGNVMDSVEKGLTLLQSLKNETGFSMNIERQRNPIELSYEVE